jgi:hypothetical protein
LKSTSRQRRPSASESRRPAYAQTAATGAERVAHPAEKLLELVGAQVARLRYPCGAGPVVCVEVADNVSLDETLPDAEHEEAAQDAEQAGPAPWRELLPGERVEQPAHVAYHEPGGGAVAEHGQHVKPELLLVVAGRARRAAPARVSVAYTCL